jgi:hypothetical protein
VTVRRLAAIAAGIMVLAVAGSAAAAPTGACLWTNLTAPQRAALTQMVTSQGPMDPGVRAGIVRGMRVCGFEATPGGGRRAGFLAAMVAARVRAEAQLAATSRVTPAQLDAAYRNMDPVLRRQVTAVAEARYAGRPPTPPDRQRFAALLAQLRLQGPQAAAAMQAYVLTRSTLEFVERLGPRFAPATPAAAPAAR